MERKEHPVPVIQAGGGDLEFLDSDGNPFKPDEPVHYQIVGEDGSILKEGDLTSDENKVSTADLGTKKFAVFVDNFIVGETEGFEPLQESVEAERPKVDPEGGRGFGSEIDWEMAAEGDSGENDEAAEGGEDGGEDSGDAEETSDDESGEEGEDKPTDSGEAPADESAPDDDSGEASEAGDEDAQDSADDESGDESGGEEEPSKGGDEGSEDSDEDSGKEEGTETDSGSESSEDEDDADEHEGPDDESG